MSLRVVPCECGQTHCYIGSGRCVGCYKQRQPSPVTSRPSPVWVKIEEVEREDVPANVEKKDAAQA